MSSPSETVLALDWPDRTLAGWIVGYLVCTLVLLKTMHPYSVLASPVGLCVTFVWCVRSGYRRPNVVPAATIGALGLVCSLLLVQQMFVSLDTGPYPRRYSIISSLSVYGVTALVGTVYGTIGHVIGRALQL